MADFAPSHDRPAVLRGTAAVLASLGEIGKTEGGDHLLAKHIVDSELEVRALVKYALASLAADDNILNS